MMKRIVTILILAFVAGCTKDIDQLATVSNTICFSAEKLDLTRVETTYLSSTWENGDAIGISCSDGPKNIEHTATIDGDYVNFTVAKATEVFEYIDEQTTYSAYYPYLASVTTTSTYTSDISGQDGQYLSDNTLAGVTANPFDLGTIDFLVADDIAPTGGLNKVDFQFTHGLSLLYFNIEVGDDMIANIDMLDLYLRLTEVPTKATYDFSTKSWTADSNSYDEIICNYLAKSTVDGRYYFTVALIVNPCKLGDTAELNISDVSFSDELYTADEITINTLAGYEFKPDTKYTFNLVYGTNNPVFTTPIEITNWSSGEDIGLDALDTVDIYYDGEEYNIFTADGLFAFADLVNGQENSTDAVTMGDGFAPFETVNCNIKGKLAVDIDLEGRPWSPIGIAYDGNTTFDGGAFDGDGHTIKNLSVEGDYSGIGLFGYIYNTTISNLTVGGHSSGNAGHVGLIAGKVYKTTFASCETLAGSTVELTSSSDSAAGIAGYIYEGTFVGCINRADITNECNYSGGMAGYANPGTITTFSDCENYGAITSIYGSGGILGFMLGGSGGGNAKVFSNCYNAGDILSKGIFAGGITGKIYGNSDGRALVINCVNVGDVTIDNSSDYIGGIVGANASGQIYNCYNWGDITGGGGSVGGLVGILEDNGDNGIPAILSNCYSCGRVMGGESSKGPVIGTFDSSTITNCYYDSDICTLDSSYGTAMSTAAMKSQNFVSILSNNAASISVSGHTAMGWCYYDSYPEFDSGAPDIVDVDIYFDGAIYYIYTAKGMKAFADLVNCNENSQSAITAAADGATFASFEEYNLDIDGILATNIDLHSICSASSNINWDPIGDFANKYKGTFDGNNHKILNLYINVENKQYQGLFGVTDAAYIKNLTVGGSISGDYTTTWTGRCAGVAAQINSSTISNCYNEVTINATTYATSIGGVVGAASGGSVIEGCSNSGAVAGVNYVGGVVGLAYEDDLIINCSNSGKVYSTSSTEGGIVGCTMVSSAVDFYTQIINCYNIGDVSGGGILGYPFGNSKPAITNCYNAWPTDDNTNYNIVGDDIAADIAEGKDTSTITNCYYDSTMSSETSQGVGRTDMKSDEFAQLLTANAATYNSNNPNNYNNASGIEASSWEYSGGYPTLVAGANSNIKIVDIYYDGEYYNIYSEDGMFAFSNLVNGIDDDSNANIEGEGYDSFGTTPHRSINGRLMQDIDLNGAEGNPWQAIGTGNVSSDTSSAYQGIFDGNGYKIKNLYIKKSESIQGLFGATYKASIINLEVGGEVVCTTYSSDSNEGHIALIVGSARETTFNNCVTTAGSTVTHSISSSTSSATHDSAGGIVGYSYDNIIIECENNATVTGNRFVGGIIGTNGDGGSETVITGCSNTGAITATGSYGAGGIAGKIFDGTIINCWNEGAIDVTGSQEAGGIAGATDSAVICNCYNQGTITGDERLGGIAGLLLDSSTVYNCYNTGSVSATATSSYGVAGENDSSTISCCYILDTSGNTDNDGVTSYEYASMIGSNITDDLDTNAYNYIVDNPTLTKPCGWISNSEDYPTLGIGTLPPSE